MEHINLKIMFIFFVCIIFITKTSAQEAENKKQINRIRLGLNYGQASQSNFPFNSPDYLYENKFLKIQINYFLKCRKKFSYEFNIEPSLYFSKHQLLNKYYIQPNWGSDYLEQREKYTQKREFKEYVINFGIITRYEIVNNISTYLLFSIGPMISEKDTERLNKGFMFSDIFGLGLSYKIKIVLIDVRLTLRHNSNANLYKPNHGHNSVGIESGILFQL